MNESLLLKRKAVSGVTLLVSDFTLRQDTKLPTTAINKSKKARNVFLLKNRFHTALLRLVLPAPQFVWMRHSCEADPDAGNTAAQRRCSFLKPVEASLSHPLPSTHWRRISPTSRANTFCLQTPTVQSNAAMLEFLPILED
jgi:hypothetical protein